jgi:alpha-tubulin suppressor-like RCC1 family protein
MRLNARHAPALLALVAVTLFTACGSTLYDAQGVPQLVPVCTNAELPLACGGACVAESDTICGPACLDCTSTSAVSGDQNARNFCNAAAADVPQHACDFSCPDGMQKDLTNQRCACASADQVRCVGTDVCVPQTVEVCGSSCTNCAAFPIDTATASSPRCAGDGKGVASTTPCDFTCPDPKLPTKSFDSGTGKWFCGPVVCDVATQHQCPSDPACYTNDNPDHCGTAAGCAVCGAPAGATPLCVNSACSFRCPDGFLRSNGACVQVRPARGSVAAGANHTCVITSAGRLMCWGLNAEGQLGLAPGPDQLTPADVPITGVQFVAAGGDRTCAVLGGGSVRCWGGGSAILDDPGVAGATAVAVGTAHACAIVAGGGVMCWGANDKGQVGKGDTLGPVTAPTAVRTSTTILTAVTRLSSSADHTCALDTEGSVYCWGANGAGQIGRAPGAPATTAFQVLNRVAVDVAAGGSHSCAAVSGDPVNNKQADTKCWGSDALSQLGDKGSGTVSPTPVLADQLDHGSDLVAAGRSHTCNVRSTDALATILCAGADDLFQAGQTPAVPSTVKGGDLGFQTSLSVLTSGGDHTCAVSIDGLMKCWGSNAHGQLGLGAGAVSGTAAPVSPLPQ